MLYIIGFSCAHLRLKKEMIAWMDFRVMKWPEELIQERVQKVRKGGWLVSFCNLNTRPTHVFYMDVYIDKLCIYAYIIYKKCICILRNMYLQYIYIGTQFVIIYIYFYLCITIWTIYRISACQACLHIFPVQVKKHESQDPIFTRAPWFDEGSSSGACKSQEPMSSLWKRLGAFV